MSEPTREAREAATVAADLWLRLPDYHRLDRRAEGVIVEALDAFAAPLRERVAQLEDALREIERADHWVHAREVQGIARAALASSSGTQKGAGNARTPNPDKETRR